MSSRYPMPNSELLRRGFNTPLLFMGALGACVLLAACTGDGSPAAPEAAAPGELFASVVKAPIEETFIQFEPCAGEDLEVHLREQIVEHESVDAQGKTHVFSVINDKGTTAVGLTSGATYHQVGATREMDKIVESLPVTVSFVNVLNLIGEGSATNVKLYEAFHLTINAEGVVTVERETQRIECK
jgi:hypothetical protein